MFGIRKSLKQRLVLCVCVCLQENQILLIMCDGCSAKAFGVSIATPLLIEAAVCIERDEREPLGLNIVCWAVVLEVTCRREIVVGKSLREHGKTRDCQKETVCTLHTE